MQARLACLTLELKLPLPHPTKKSATLNFLCARVCHLCAKSLQFSLTLCDPMDCSPPARLLCPWDSPGKITGVGCHALLQGIFLTQGLNQHLYVSFISRWVLYH